MKRIFCVITALILSVVLPCVAAAAMPDTPATEAAFYAADYADIFSKQTRESIVAANQSLRTEIGAEVVVVTANYTENLTAAEYAKELGIRWRVGSKQFKNGVVIVINKETADYAICYGSGNENMQEDGQAALTAALSPERTASGFDAPFSEFFVSLTAQLKEGAGGELDYYKKHADYTFTGFRQNASGGMSNVDSSAIGFGILFFIAVGAVIALITVFAHRRDYKNESFHRFPFRPFMFINGWQPRLHRRSRFDKGE